MHTTEIMTTTTRSCNKCGSTTTLPTHASFPASSKGYYRLSSSSPSSAESSNENNNENSMNQSQETKMESAIHIYNYGGCGVN